MGAKQKGGRMSTHLRLNLEYYRKAAKALLRAAQSGDAAALERIARHSTKPLALNQAQLTIAGEHGFASWPRFRAFLAESATDFPKLLAAFIDAATEDPRRANEMLARHPETAGAGLYPALVLGDARTVEVAIKNSPAIVTSKGGPLNWEPLLYVCFSRMNYSKLAETARLLLGAGADPNGYYVDPRWPDMPLSCLYGATGRNNHPVLARVLLEAGARPDDGESLYHSTEHADLACVRLLLEYGASPQPANALKHMLDYENLEGLSVLLAAGANPNDRNPRGETALYWAVWRARSAAIVTALLDAGADIDAKRNDGRTAYAIAVRSGQREIANLLERRGANTEIAELDRFMGACAAADPEELRRMTASITLPVEYAQLLPELASSRRTSAVRTLLAAGVPPNTIAPDGDATALHWACWKGYADLVKLLLDHGAALNIEDKEFHGTPAGWFSHGFVNSPERDGDYVETARLLVAAGAAIEPTGDPTVDAALA
jgi:ankyrin repeat protein